MFTQDPSSIGSMLEVSIREGILNSDPLYWPARPRVVSDAITEIIFDRHVSVEGSER
jgi:hypothetical protein